MTTDQQISGGPYALPQLAEVFDALRRGRHLCLEDGDIYRAVHEHIDQYRELFKNLGFRFEEHPRGFYYFRGAGSVSDLTSKMAVFMFILVEAVADTSESVEQAIMSRPMAMTDLPHLKTERYRGYLKEVGVVTDDDLEQVVSHLIRFGFAHRLDSGSFRFRSPAYRFFDVALEILNELSKDKEQP